MIIVPRNPREIRTSYDFSYFCGNLGAKRSTDELCPAEYKWSSSAARCGFRGDSILSKSARWESVNSERPDWYTRLDTPEVQEKIAAIRRNTSRDLPTGSEPFFDLIEEEFGISLRSPMIGRGRKEEKS